jgi:uncharacterized repeat protein (TIGR01451 family)
MLRTRVGAPALRRALAIVTALLLVAATAATTFADVGNVTVGAQSPNPVAAGQAATYAVTAENTSAESHRFRVQASGGPGGTTYSTVCQSIPGGSSAALTMTVTPPSSASGTYTLTFTVREYESDTSCAGDRIGSEVSRTAPLVVAPQPLTVTLYKEICPTYSLVPGNDDRWNYDDTGGHWDELDMDYQLVEANPATDIPAGCAPRAGWQFEFLDGQYGSVIGTYTTDASGRVSVSLSSAQIALARSSGGLWVREVLQPSAPFAAIRCYTDMLNGDNLERIDSVPTSRSEVFCLAYNVEVASPALGITKSASPSTYSAVGNVITYTYTLTNTGNVTLAGPFTVTDDRTSATCPATASLAPNATLTCTASYSIAQADLDGGSVTNTASGHALYGGNPVDSAAASATANAIQTPALSVAKSAGSPTYASVGDVVTYDYLVRNTGNVTLVSPFAVSDDRVSVSCPATASLAPNATLTCTASHTVTLADLDAGSITNTASASAHFGTDTITSSDASVTVNAVQNPALGLSVSASPSTYSAVGNVITYTYTLTNTGNVTLVSAFSVTDTVAATTCPATASLAPGATLTCTGTHTITQADLDAGSLTDSAIGYGHFGLATIASAPAGVTVTADQNPALGIAKSASTPTYNSVGNVIDYTYVLTNTGNVTLSGPFTIDDDRATVTCDAAASLAPGATLTCTAATTIDQALIDAGSLTNTAAGHAWFGGVEIDSSSVSVTVTADQNPALGLAKSTLVSSYSAVGDVIGYTYVLTNTGNVTLAGPFTVSDDRAVVTCDPAASLAPNATLGCTASYEITQADVDAGSVTNTATGSGLFGTNPIVSAPASARVDAAQLAAISIAKTADPADYDSVGDVIAYTYTLTNTGNVTLVSPFAVDDDKVSVSCTAVASLAPDASIDCTASYTITQADIDGNSVTNTASASAYFGALEVTSPSVSATVSAIRNPALNLVKTADVSTYDEVGDVIAYTYTLTNTGNVTLAGPFTVSDDKVSVSCPSAVSLAPDASIGCTASYTIAQADIDAGSVTNAASGHGAFDGEPVDSGVTGVTVTATQSPALDVAKSADVSTYDEVGDVIAYTYTLTNTGNVTLAGPFSVSDDKASVSCPAVASLAPDASIDCTASYTIAQADIDAGSVTNTATGHGSFHGAPVDSDPVGVTVGAVQRARLSIVKSADVSTYAQVGDVINYTYTLTNSGNVTLAGPFTVVDDRATATCPATASLVPGASIICNASYVVEQADIDAGSVTNTAFGSGSLDGASIDSAVTSVTVNADQTPALGLSKTPDTSSYDEAGDLINYTYVLTNTGNVTLTGPFSVSDDRAVVSCDSATSLAPDATLTCHASYSVSQADVDTGSVTNTATGHASFESDPVSSETVVVTVFASQSASLGIAKTADPLSYSAVGTVIDYEYVLTNTGNVTLSGPFTVVDDRATVTCPAPVSLAVGASITCNASYVIEQGDIDAGAVTNNATAYATFGSTTVNSPIGRATVTASQSPGLGLTKTASVASVDEVGDVIDYTYTLSNTGNVTVDGPFTVADSMTTVSCPATASLAPATSIICTASFTVTQFELDLGVIVNLALGSGRYAGAEISSNLTFASVAVEQQPALGLEKSASPLGYSSAGDVIVYTYILTNTGNVTLAGPFSVSDDRATVTCDAAASLAPDASLSCTASYTITQADVDGGSVTNTATGHGSFHGAPVDSAADSVTVRAAQGPALSLVKSADVSTYDEIGDVINYSYTLGNTGNVTLTGPFSVSDDKATVTCDAAASLAHGASISCTASHTITQADLDAGSVVNHATGHGSFGGSTVDSNVATATVTAEQTASLAMGKFAGASTYDEVGDVIAYAYTLTNTGNVSLTGPFSVSDDRVSVVCPATASLAPGASITCNAGETIDQADLDGGSVTNNAVGHAYAGGSTIDSNTATVTVTAEQGPRLGLIKIADVDTYNTVGSVVGYTYFLTNTGNVTLSGPFTVSDDKVTVICPADESLAPEASIACSAAYAVTQADLDAGEITNNAIGHAVFGGLAIDSNSDSATVYAAQGPALSMVKAADVSSYNEVGDVISYTYVLRNTGNVTLSGPFSVSDDKVTVVCPADESLAQNATLTCTAGYTITQADLDGGSVTNNATGHASFGGSPVNSSVETITVDADQLPALGLAKTADPLTYAAVGDVISYTYVLTNTGNVTLSGPFTVADDMVGVSCPSDATLAPEASITCTASYTITQADMDDGAVINHAIGRAWFAGDPVESAGTSATSGTTAIPSLEIVKTADVSSYAQVGDVVNYEYVLRNTGNVTLSGPFTVSDDRVSVACPATPASLAPGEAITCTASYMVSEADLTAGSVTNNAIGHAVFGQDPVDSSRTSVTVEAALPTPTPYESVGGATATPYESVGAATNRPPRRTPPGTSTGGGPLDEGSAPYAVLLICLAFGGLGLLAIQAQRRATRR